MDIVPAKRMEGIKPYFFTTLEKTISHLKQAGVDVIRLDMGSPDLPPEDFIIQSLVDAAWKPDNHGYGPSGGTAALRQAFVDYYGERFDIELDPESEALGLIGSKEGLFNLSQVLVNPGDLVLIPDPSYPVYTAGAVIAQARIFTMPLMAENAFLPDFDAIPAEVVANARLMWLNYPNNPTGAVAPYAFFEEAVAFAQANKIVIAHDAPYMEICYDHYKASSILQVPGAREVAVEFNSISKTYNMAGWRVGVVVGNQELIRLLKTYKSQMDSSLFKPIMEAAITAVKGDQTWIEDRNQVYQDRRDVIVETLLAIGFRLEIPRASLYVWAHLPEGWKDSIAFCDQVLRETGVSMTPGDVYGASGKGYIRISLVTPKTNLKQAMERLFHWMEKKV